MRIRFFSDDDGWSLEGSKINSPEILSAIEDLLEHQGATIIVERQKYRGASAPDRHICDEYEEFLDYLEEHCFAGDIITVWNMYDLCTRENAFVSGKCPDDDGRVPERGAY